MNRFFFGSGIKKINANLGIMIFQSEKIMNTDSFYKGNVLSASYKRFKLLVLVIVVNDKISI